MHRRSFSTPSSTEYFFIFRRSRLSSANFHTLFISLGRRQIIILDSIKANVLTLYCASFSALTSSTSSLPLPVGVLSFSPSFVSLNMEMITDPDHTVMVQAFVSCTSRRRSTGNKVWVVIVNTVASHYAQLFTYNEEIS